MYKAIIIICLSFCSMHLNAQFELNNLYKVYVSDDSRILVKNIFRGELISYEEDYIELRLQNGQIEKILTNHISHSIQFYQPFPEISNYDYIDDFSNGTSFRVRGSYIIFQLTLSPHTRPEKTGEGSSSFQTSYTIINGYQFTNGNAIGLGFNLNLHDNSFTPVFVDYRLYIFRSPVSIFASGNLGYAFAFEQFEGNSEKEQKGGTMYQLGLGLNFATKYKTNIIVELARRNQLAKEKFPFQYRFEKHHFKNFVFQIGITL